MSVICPKVSKALTLIELMVAIAIIAIVAVGALDCQYYAAKHSRTARNQIAATRTAQLLIEDWKSVGGSTYYNPLNLQLDFSSATVPADFTMGQSIGFVLNNVIYTITINGMPMLIMLGWSDVAHDSIAETTLRQLTVMVRWPQGGALCNSPVILTTYVRLDG
jgi:prepilin-type N-terminal cleavage/methylation domain-containing protein